MKQGLKIQIGKLFIRSRFNTPLIFKQFNQGRLLCFVDPAVEPAKIRGDIAVECRILNDSGRTIFSNRGCQVRPSLF